ncbi:MAG: transporter substrate-binding domain-containing protein [Cyclobacteriaceae bacterium]|nr:transporter substrate-binding domain-containing protein [Cyclobacteriaceae bacterium]
MILKLKRSCSRFLFFMLLPTFFLMGCSNQSNRRIERLKDRSSTIFPDPVDFDFAAIKKRGTIRVILENTSTGYFLYKGRPMGLQYELARRFSEEMGLSLEVVVENDLEKGLQLLQEGQGDVLAHSLTITKERREIVGFSDAYYEIRQMLVQRKPDNWQMMPTHEIERGLIRSPTGLIGHEVYVKKGSSFVRRLRNLSEEIGGDIVIIEEFGDVLTEELIHMVSRNEIDYTVADEDIANISATYFQNLDVETPISLPTQVAWAIRKNAPELLNALNDWIRLMKMRPDFNVLYRRYFKDPKGFRIRLQSDFSSMGGQKISPYDDIIKKHADKIKWDWRLLAALIHQESNFNPRAESWMGAKGLMQLIPQTAESFGAADIFNPEDNILAGSNYLNWLDNYWEKYVQDSTERKKFVMASFNAGPGHVLDAVRLTEKYGRDPHKWEDNVEYYLLQKSKPKFFKDPVVNSGYCRGSEPVEYIRDVFLQFDIYKQFIET